LADKIGLAVVVAGRRQNLAGQAHLGELVDRPPLAGPGQERTGLDDESDSRARVLVVELGLEILRGRFAAVRVAFSCVAGASPAEPHESAGTDLGSERRRNVLE